MEDGTTVYQVYPSFLVSFLLLNFDQPQLVEERTSRSHFSTERSQDRIPAGTEAEDAEDFCFLVLLTPAQLAFLYSTSSPAQNSAHSGWNCYIQHQSRQFPTGMVKSKSKLGNFPIEVSSSWVTLGCVILTIKLTRTSSQTHTGPELTSSVC